LPRGMPPWRAFSPIFRGRKIGSGGPGGEAPPSGGPGAARPQARLAETISSHPPATAGKNRQAGRRPARQKGGEAAHPRPRQRTTDTHPPAAVLGKVGRAAPKRVPRPPDRRAGGLPQAQNRLQRLFTPADKLAGLHIDLKIVVLAV